MLVIEYADNIIFEQFMTTPWHCSRSLYSLQCPHGARVQPTMRPCIGKTRSYKDLENVRMK